jgi:hypothetical protein
MTTQTKAKIMLSALVAGGGLPLAIYFLTIDEFVLYGWIMVLLVLGILTWLWKPWNWFRKS